MNTINLHMIEVKYYGPTNSRGSRIKLTSHRFEDSLYVPYNYKFNTTLDIARDYLEEQGCTIVGSGETKNGYIIAITNFKSLSDIKYGQLELVTLEESLGIK